MKKNLIFLGIITCFISSCNEPAYKETDNRKVEIITSDNFREIKYVEFDGHEYVRFFNGHRGSLCHSPKCPCLKEYKK
jgi:hypothetical protein